MGLSYTDKVIAKCLQDYGMYFTLDAGPITTTGAGIAILCVSTKSAKNNPYAALQTLDPTFNPSNNFALNPIIIQHCRVIQTPENTNPATQVNDEPCGAYSTNP